MEANHRHANFVARADLLRDRWERHLDGGSRGQSSFQKIAAGQLLHRFVIRCDTRRIYLSHVAQVSKLAVSPTSKSAGIRTTGRTAGLETGDTADLEVCATFVAALLQLHPFTWHTPHTVSPLPP